MGVEPQGIYAIDTDKHQLGVARNRFKDSGVHFVHCKFEEAHKVLGVKKFASACIDLCGPISINTIRAVPKLNAEVVSYEFMCCREQGSAARFVRSNKDEKCPATKRLEFLKVHGFNPFVGLYYMSSTETTRGEPMCMAIMNNNRTSSRLVVREVKATYTEQRRRITYSKGDHMGNLYNIPKETVAGWRSWEIRNGKPPRNWRSKK